MLKTISILLLCTTVLFGCASVDSTSVKIAEDITPYSQIIVIFDDTYSTDVTKKISDYRKRTNANKVIRRFLNYAEKNITQELQQKADKSGLKITFLDSNDKPEIDSETAIMIVGTESYNVSHTSQRYTTYSQPVYTHSSLRGAKVATHLYNGDKEKIWISTFFIKQPMTHNDTNEEKAYKKLMTVLSQGIISSLRKDKIVQ